MIGGGGHLGISGWMDFRIRNGGYGGPQRLESNGYVYQAGAAETRIDLEAHI